MKRTVPTPDRMNDASCVSAAEWFAVAALHDARADGADFTAWLAEPDNRDAYEQAEAVWRGLDAVVRRQRPEPVRAAPPPPRRRFAVPLAPALAIAASLALAVVAVPLLLVGRDSDFATRIGEQRTVLLADDSRVTLNTDTRLSVDFDEDDRTVSLERGEALFEVAHDAGRPFIVRIGADEVRAIGTEFIVRRDSGQVLVTLLRGKVAVTGEGAARAPILLDPGDRVVLAARAAARRDRPQLDSVTAWRRGELVLRQTPVSEAVREMNRYSNARIEIGAPRVAAAELTGVFKLGRNGEFANTLGALYGLEVANEGDRLILRERKKN